MPERAEETLVEAVKAAHPDLVEESEALGPRKVSVVVRRDGLPDLARSLRDEFGFTHPVSAGAIDYPRENRMRMIYYLMNPSTRILLTLRVDLPRDDLTLPSMTRVWEAMSFHEREAREMFGIEFEGHPNPVPLLLPPDWRGGYPLRKDFKGEGART
ncbi:MAG: NADH-quinone oxidoreductase subunit C [Candidatus Bathyarchaeia archaeon]